MVRFHDDSNRRLGYRNLPHRWGPVEQSRAWSSHTNANEFHLPPPDVDPSLIHLLYLIFLAPPPCTRTSGKNVFARHAPSWIHCERIPPRVAQLKILKLHTILLILIFAICFHHLSNLKLLRSSSALWQQNNLHLQATELSIRIAILGAPDPPTLSPPSLHMCRPLPVRQQRVFGTTSLALHLRHLL